MRTKLVLTFAGAIIAAGAFTAGMLVERNYLAREPAAPNPPDLLAPADGAVLNTNESKMWEFSWSRVPEAEGYHISIKRAVATPYDISQDVDVPVYRVHSPHSYSAVPPYDKGWTWKVKVQVAGRWSKWSEVRKFDIESKSK